MVHVLLALPADLVDVVGERVADVLDGSVLVLLADQLEVAVVAVEVVLGNRPVVLEVGLEVREHRQRREVRPPVVRRVHNRLGDLVADESGRDAVHPLADVRGRLAVLAELSDVDVVAVVDLAVVGLRLLDQRDRLVGLGDPREDAEEPGHLQGVRLDVHVRNVGVPKHLPVDLRLLVVL